MEPPGCIWTPVKNNWDNISETVHFATLFPNRLLIPTKFPFQRYEICIFWKSCPNDHISWCPILGASWWFGDSYQNFTRIILERAKNIYSGSWHFYWTIYQAGDNYLYNWKGLLVLEINIRNFSFFLSVIEHWKIQLRTDWCLNIWLLYKVLQKKIFI